MNKRSLSTLVASAAVLVLLLVLAMPRTGKFSYDYRKGQPWRYETFFAPFDFPIYKTFDELRKEKAEASAEMVPYYRYAEDVVNKNLKTAQGLELGEYRNVVVSRLRSVLDKWIIADEGVRTLDDGSVPDVIYIQRNKRAVKYPSSELYRMADARAKLLADVSQATGRADMDSILNVSGAYALIVPNLVYDSQTTELVHAESTMEVSPTSGFVSSGQLIVSNGEIVTAEIAQILDSYKKEYEDNVGVSGPRFLMWFGEFLLALALLALLFFAVWFICPEMLGDSRSLYVMTVFAIGAIGSLLLSRIDEELLYLFPFTIVALYQRPFFKPGLILPVYLISLIPVMVFAGNGAQIFVMFAVGGVVACYLFKRYNKGWMQFMSAAVTFLSMLVVFIAFRALDMIGGNFWRISAYLFVASFLNIALFPAVYLFERVFNLVSNTRLRDLSDTSGALLQELEQKAPGTFQHSLQVMNMADAVARAIDINPVPVRVGALYHDIGKMNNPLCFVENESLVPVEDGQKYHDSKTPEESAMDIVRHVADGVETARKHHLPNIIVDFILTHHGTTVVRYFYNKFLESGGDPSGISSFTYNGRKPADKAQIVLMLCDSIEAASRTLKDYSPESCSRFVEAIVAGKMEEGQFDEADITIREIGIVKETLKQYLVQSHHGRIVYPNNK